MSHAWYLVGNVQEVDSPALLVYPDRIEENIRRMIRLAGGVERLRPHIKTHKMPEVMRLKLAAGIKKFKCATIAEAELSPRCGAPDVLMAYHPGGPKIARLIRLIRRFPNTKCSTIAGDPVAIQGL